MNAIWLIVLWLPFATPHALQQSQLEEQAKKLFLTEHGTTDVKNRLRQLGNDNEVAAILMQLAGKYRHASQGTLEIQILEGAVRTLGEIRLTSANELLSSFLTDREVHRTVRAQAVQALGQIDPEANKQTLLKALDPKESDYVIMRVYAAEGLAKTKDPEVLKALERFGREEIDSYVRGALEKAAKALREKGVRPN